MDILKNPLNYTGAKYKQMEQLLSKFPKEIDLFIDAFGGGATVSINVNAKKVVYIDSDKDIVEILKILAFNDIDKILHDIYFIINKYELNTTIKGDTCYLQLSKQISSEKKEKFCKLRQDYNDLENKDTYQAYIMCLVLTFYSYCNKKTKNKKNEFNEGFGNRGFNPNRKENIIKFNKRCHEIDITFIHGEFDSIKNFNDYNKNNVFVYFDPPYLVTNVYYIKGTNWNGEKEQRLFNYMNCLTNQGIKWGYSNILKNDCNVVNEYLEEYIRIHNLHIYDVDISYNNSYNKKKENRNNAQEILALNYKPL
jgi:DNA adenine methylase Dam